MKFEFKNLLLIYPLIVLCGCIGLNLPKQTLEISDAEKFARIFSSNSVISAEVLQSQYLDEPSEGIKIFTPDRIESAANLVKSINENPQDYRHAIKECLPVVRNLSPSASRILKRVANLIGEEDIAPTYILFGANNSGGTARANGLVIGLEVACKGSNKETFSKNFLRLIAHESAHVYQVRKFDANSKIDLLYFTISEGSADFIAQLALGSVDYTSEREVFGKANEKMLWREFKADLDAGIGGDSDWFYRAGRNNRPKDLGYYIGRRISEEYYSRAIDKKKALRDLIEMKDTRKILADSHFDELQR